MKDFKKNNIKKNKQGATTLLILILFLAAISSLALGSIVVAHNELKTTNDLYHSFQAHYAAEGVLEDVMYRLKNSMSLSNPETLQVGTASTTVSYSNEIGGSRVITGIGESHNCIRKIVVTFGLTNIGEASFHYGAQAGDGGVLIEDGSNILGNLFSNGDVNISSNSTISESVKVALNSNSVVGGQIGGNVHVAYCEEAQVSGILYCNNHTNCIASSIISPLSEEIVPVDLPISDEQIDDWKENALSGGVYNGDIILSSWNTLSLGPKKIIGNLILSGQSVLTITGTLWVTGNINIYDKAIIKLDNGYGSTSGTLIADGTVLLEDTATAEGSGQESSYLIIVSTYNSGTAITIQDGFQADILFANLGEILVKNTSDLREVTGYRLHLQNNAEVTYESGLADIDFTGGPAGSWSVISWRESN